MAKTPKNNGKKWTDSDVNRLEKLVKENTPTGLIAYELVRSQDTIRSKASDLDISLKPTNKSPYNKRKNK